MDQPFRAHAKDLLEQQEYPEMPTVPSGERIVPYDMAGWSLSLQMGVEVITVEQQFEYEGETLARYVIPPGRVFGSGDQVVLLNESVQESRTVAQALQSGAKVWMLQQAINDDGVNVPAGSLVLEGGNVPSLAVEHSHLYGFDVFLTSSQPKAEDVITRLPRIVLYQPWTANRDEGWTRWVFEQHGIPFATVTNLDLRGGSLRESFDVLVLPSMARETIVSGNDESRAPPPFSGGLNEEGSRAVVEFVQRGGVLVVLGRAADYAISEFDLPINNVQADTSAGARDSLFYAPGSILAVRLEGQSAITSGVPDLLHVFFDTSPAFDVSPPARTLARYVTEPLRSGYADHEDYIVDRAAMVDIPVGEGRIVLIGFRPQHRGQTYGTFKLLFNSVLLGRLP